MQIIWKTCPANNVVQFTAIDGIGGSVRTGFTADTIELFSPIPPRANGRCLRAVHYMDRA